MSTTPKSEGLSARSSITAISRSGSAHDLKEKVDTHSLAEEIGRRAEESIEYYGADDVHEPEPKTPIERPGGVVRVEPIVNPPAPQDENKVVWDGPDDPENPQNWSKSYKWFITFVCMIITVNVTFASSAPTVATIPLRIHFGISREVSDLVTTVFLLGYVFGPLVWGPGSELVGRKPVFAFAMVFYTLFHLGQALAPNIQTLLVTRFFSGFFAVAPLTNCGGIIADMWDAVGRGPATSLFTAAVFVGPVLGPIVSGFMVEQHVDWRWVFWTMMLFAGVCTAIGVPLLPETYAPVILLKKAKRLRAADPVKNKDRYADYERQDWSFKGVVDRTLFRPFNMLIMEPILVLITIYLSVVYGLLYALFEAFPIIFYEIRGFTIGESGLIFLGIGIGTTLGSFINILTVRHYTVLVPKWRGFPPPEQRLFGAMIGSPVLALGVFWLGWTGNYASVSWVAPAISTIFIGTGISLIFMSFLSYLIDTYLMYAASAFAANTIVRSAVAAAFPLFTVQLFTNLGVNWASTLIGFILLAFVPCPFLFYKFGARIRAHSKFAPCLDLQIAEELEREKQAGAV